MKNINKFLLVNLTMLLIVSFSAFAQQNETQRERFQEEKIKYFNEKLELSEDQKVKFWKVYNDFHNRMMKLNDDERNLLQYYSSNKPAMSDQEIDETIEEYMNIQSKRSNLTSEYHQSFVVILGKRKTMELYTLERSFRMHIIDTFKRGRNGQGSGRGYYGRGSRK